MFLDLQLTGLGRENPLSGWWGEKMTGVKYPSLQMQQEHPLVLWKPLSDVGALGEWKGLLVKIEESVGSFLVAEMRDFLGRITVEIGQLLIME